MVVSAFSSWRSAMLVNICRNLTAIWGCRSINTSKSGLKNPNKVQSVLHKADVLRFRLYPMDKGVDMSKYVLHNDNYNINSGHILVSKFRSDLLQVDPNRTYHTLTVFGDGQITRMGIGSSWFMLKDFPIDKTILSINNYTNRYCDIKIL